MTDKESFKKEFKALLEKYDVTIGFLMVYMERR